MQNIKKIKFLTLTFILIFCPIINPKASALNCKNYEIIFARGTGEKLKSRNYQTFRTALNSELSKVLHKNQFHFYELGEKSQNGYRYPAVNLPNPFSILSAKFNPHSEFAKSIHQGTNELQTYFNQIASACPQTKFILAGYSQGAQVIITLLPKLDSSKITYIATFGDPKTYLPEGKGIIPPACRGKNFSSYRQYAPDCYTFQGILGGQKPYHNPNLEHKVGLWCNLNDPICGSRLKFQKDILKPHTSYLDHQLYQDASKIIMRHISKKPNLKPRHNLVILFDTTGSMSNLINQYKAQAHKIIDHFQNTNGKIAIYEYRDLKDPFYPRPLCLKDCTYRKAKNAIDNITVKNGGDTPESALNAINFVLDNFNWESHAQKTLILITDASYHSPDRDGTTLSQIIQKSLLIDPVNIFSITPDNIKDFYQEITAKTGGKNFTNNTDLDFSTNFILHRPTLNFTKRTYSETIDNEIEFELNTDRTANSYQWDLDGDGIFETKTNLPSIKKTYRHPANIFIQAKAINSLGLFSTASANLAIHPQPISTSATKIKSYKLKSQDSNFSLNLELLNAKNTKALLITSNNLYEFILPPQNLTSITLYNLPKNINLAITPISETGNYGPKTLFSLNQGKLFFHPNSLDSSNQNTIKPNPKPLTTNSYQLSHRHNLTIPKVPDTSTAQF